MVKVNVDLDYLEIQHDTVSIMKHQYPQDYYLKYICDDSNDMSSIIHGQLVVVGRPLGGTVLLEGVVTGGRL